MTKQNNYKDWFWSNLPAEESNTNQDLLAGYSHALEAENPFAAYPTTLLDQVTAYLKEIEETVVHVRLEEKERQLELVRGAASMFILQGDLKGAEVCQTIENLLRAADQA